MDANPMNMWLIIMNSFNLNKIVTNGKIQSTYKLVVGIRARVPAAILHVHNCTSHLVTMYICVLEWSIF